MRQDIHSEQDEVAGVDAGAAAKPRTASATRMVPAGSQLLTNRFWTAPNQITLLRLIFIPFVIISVFDAQWRWALVLLLAAAASDALDGLLARALRQQTLLGQYLDPIADKLLLSSLFLVLVASVRKISLALHIAVFSRDLCIVATAVVLYAAVGFRDFRPSIFGKLNTACQIATVFFVVLSQVVETRWLPMLVKLLLYGTFTFTTISGVHYVLPYRISTAQCRTNRDGGRASGG